MFLFLEPVFYVFLSSFVKRTALHFLYGMHINKVVLLLSLFIDFYRVLFVDGVLSDFLKILNGMPQGSILEPMSFLTIH